MSQKQNNLSYSPLWSPKRVGKKIEWKRKWLANRAARAEVNSTFNGENGSKRAGEYHGRLKALRAGLA